MTIRDALTRGTRTLAAKAERLSDAVLDAEILLAHAGKTDRVGLYRDMLAPVPHAQLASYRTLLLRRQKGIPVAFLTGTKAFFHSSFAVRSGACLIPRPETEILVERALAFLKQHAEPLRVVIDVGTGSGAIAASIARENTRVTVLATDISRRALRLAEQNADSLGVSDRIRFSHVALLPRRLPAAHSLLIIANLPYIPTAAWKRLPPHIRRYEPRAALDGGRDGLAIYQKLFTLLARRCRKKSWTLLAELDPQEREGMRRAVHTRIPGATIRFDRDQCGKIRCAEITWVPLS